MNEHTLQLLAVVTLVTSSLVHMVIHAVTTWALGPDTGQDPLLTALRRREASLAVKAMTRLLFDLMLLGLVVVGALWLPDGVRTAVYVGVAIAALGAIWYGVRFLVVLRRANWGRPSETKNDRDKRQDARSDGLDIRAEGLDKRGAEMSREMIRRHGEEGS